MAYKIKSREELDKEINEHLIENPIENAYEENLILNFSSHELSDLYKLFLDIKGKQINRETFEKIKQILFKNYFIEPNSVLKMNKSEYVIEDDEVKNLANVIKDRYLENISSNDETNISKEELYKMALIVNKAFPSFFIELIKNPVANIEEDKNIIEDRIWETIDHWQEHTSVEAEEENRDILGALYISTKKLYPELGIYVPGRIKSTRSSINNIKKEAANSLNALVPSDVTVGLTQEDVKNNFSMEKAITDFSGFTIVLGDSDDTMHFDINDPKTSELLKLRKNKDSNIRFLHSLENFLSENDSHEFEAGELLQMKLELLMRLRQLTYEECRKEYKGTSFTELFVKTKKIYDEKQYEKDDLYDEVEYENKIDEIYELLDEVKKRVHDKYRAKILEIALPEILKEELISEELHIKARFVKHVKKENGFCADYYELTTHSGRKIELQAITKMRFKESKDGSSDHSNLPDKGIEISQFFEPASDECSEHTYSKMLKLLNDTPIAKKNNLYITPDQQLSPTDRRLKKKLKAAENNVKLKEFFEEEHIYEDGSMTKCSYNLDTYLLHFAKFVSPKMMSVSSHHTRFHKGVSNYNKKSLLSEFTEVLLKHDSTSCLGQILIDKLDTLLDNDKNEISRNGIIRRANERYGKAAGNISQDDSDERY